MWPKVRTHAVTAILFLALGFALGRGCSPDVITKSVTRWEHDTVSVYDTVTFTRFEKTVVPYVGGDKIINDSDPAGAGCGSYAVSFWNPWHTLEFSGADSVGFIFDCNTGGARNFTIGYAPRPVRNRYFYYAKSSGSAEVVTLEQDPDLFQVWAGGEYDVLPHLFPSSKPSYQFNLQAGLFFRNVQITVGPALSPAGLQFNIRAQARLF